MGILQGWRGGLSRTCAAAPAARRTPAAPRRRPAPDAQGDRRHPRRPAGSLSSATSAPAPWCPGGSRPDALLHPGGRLVSSVRYTRDAIERKARRDFWRPSGTPRRARRARCLLQSGVIGPGRCGTVMTVPPRLPVAAPVRTDRSSCSGVPGPLRRARRAAGSIPGAAAGVGVNGPIAPPAPAVPFAAARLGEVTPGRVARSVATQVSRTARRDDRAARGSPATRRSAEPVPRVADGDLG